MPWLHGLDVTASSTGILAPRAPADEVSDGCGVAASRTIELVADVAPSAGRETIVASYSAGVAVFDREDHLVADLPGYPCEGSADELDVVAFGTAHRLPTLAIAATSGGHRENATWIALFRTGRTLHPLFTAVVETRADGVVTQGAIYLLPDHLMYKRPGGRTSLWRLDPNANAYVPVLPEIPHDEPPLISLLGN
jgi:hypothetical protein